MSDAHVIVLKTNQTNTYIAKTEVRTKLKTGHMFHLQKRKTHRRGQIHSLTSHLNIYHVKPVGQVLYSYGRLW